MITLRAALVECAWLVVSIGGTAHAQFTMPTEKPVPSELLSDGVLRVEDSNFKVEAPGKKWQWTMFEHDVLQGVPCYGCKKGNSGVIFLVYVQKGKTWDTGPAFRNGLREGAERTAAKSNAKILRYEVSDSDVPLPGSVRIDMTMKHPIGLEMDTQSFVFAAGSIYTVETVWIRGGPRPPDFDGFVRSFALLRPSPRPTPLGHVPWGILAGAAVIGLAIGSGGNRLLLKGAILMAALISLATLGLLGVVAWRMETGAFSMEEVGRRCGEACLPVGLAMIGALIAAARLRRAAATDMPTDPAPYVPGITPLPPDERS